MCQLTMAHRADIQETTDMTKTTLIVLACVLAACSKGEKHVAGGTDTAVAVTPAAARAAADSGAASSAPPRAVADVGEYGEQVYDQATASNWAKAKSLMDSLDAAAKALPDESRTAAERTQLTGVLDTLRSAVAAKQRGATTEAANRVTYLAAKISAPYNPPTPVDVVLLDYYGRELEVQAARKDMAGLKATAVDIRRTWDAVKPQVVSHGGAAAAAKTDSLVAKIEAAKSPAEYSRLAKPFLDVVDELEKPFQK
jgi:hypothetical protein